MEKQRVFQVLSQDDMYLTVGGDQEDYDFGYRIGAAAKTVYNAVCDACDNVVDWFNDTF